MLAVWAAAVAAQQASGQKKPITHDVYDSWRSIQGTRLSRDGGWVVYALVAQEGDGELVVRNLKTNAEIRQPRGRDASITPDGKFVVFTIAPPRADVDKAKKDKKKPDEMPKAGLGILDLGTGKAVTFERVKNFKIPEESGKFVAYLFEAPEKKADAKEEKKEEPKAAEEKKDAVKKKKEKKKDPGTELVVRDLAAGTETKVAEVVDYAWGKNGDWLAYAVSSKKPENDGAYARKMADGSVKPLMTGLGNYKQLAFDEAGTQVAFVSDRDDYKADASPYRLYHWAPPAEKAVEIAALGNAGMPKASSVSENGRPEFSKDGTRLFFGTAPAPKAEPEDAPDAVKVDLWHWKDPELQPMQKVRADEEKKRSYRATVSLKDKKVVSLADRGHARPAPERGRHAGPRAVQRPVSAACLVGRRLRGLLHGQPRRRRAQEDRREGALRGDAVAFRQLRPLLRPQGRQLVRREDGGRQGDEAHRQVDGRALRRRNVEHAGASARRGASPGGPKASARCSSTTGTTSGNCARTARRRA